MQLSTGFEVDLKKKNVVFTSVQHTQKPKKLTQRSASELLPSFCSSSSKDIEQLATNSSFGNGDLWNTLSCRFFAYSSESMSKLSFQTGLKVLTFTVVLPMIESSTAMFTKGSIIMPWLLLMECRTDTCVGLRSEASTIFSLRLPLKGMADGGAGAETIEEKAKKMRKVWEVN